PDRAGSAGVALFALLADHRVHGGVAHVGLGDRAVLDVPPGDAVVLDLLPGDELSTDGGAGAQREQQSSDGHEPRGRRALEAHIYVPPGVVLTRPGTNPDRWTYSRTTPA